MVFLELLQTYPRISIIIFAILISFFISLVNFFILDKDKMREIKARQKQLQNDIKQHQKAGNHDKVMELNKELLSFLPETFKHSFKPMIITFLPIIILFGFIRTAYASTTLAGSWFWWYLITAIIASMIFRKLLKLP
ncbi:DUF106 domain-containing protein [Candidatus Pacearchaeota archaeon]|nr:DUF106 domain-containing protein [Candidatus Pacearchaeota archaeon]